MRTEDPGLTGCGLRQCMNRKGMLPYTLAAHRGAAGAGILVP